MGFAGCRQSISSTSLSRVSDLYSTSLKDSRQQVVPVISIGTCEPFRRCQDGLGLTLWCKTPALAHSQHENHLMNDPCRYSLTVRPCRFFDITYIFLNEEWYLTSQRVMKLAVYYTRVNVFSIYLLLFVYRCVLFFKTSPIFWEGFS